MSSPSAAHVGTLDGVPDRIEGYLRRRPTFLVVGLGLVLLVASALFSATQGTVVIPVSSVWQMLWSKIPGLSDVAPLSPSWPASHEAVVFHIRLPRIVLAGLVGASLAAAGATYQGLFRNPLADPYLIGVASGAGLGAVVALVLPLPALLYSWGVVQWSAFVMAVLVVIAVYLLARIGGATPVSTLILAGVALGAFASAITSFLMYLHGEELHAVYTWLLGGFSLGSWQQVLTILPYTLLGLAVVYLYARPLNVLLLDEEQAAHLGINVEQVKLVMVVAATLLTAAAVSVSGLIGFVGLIVPHAIRLLWGSDHRLLLPASALAGAVFLLWADTLARSAFAPMEVPVGVVTAFCGAPFFLYLLRQRKQRVL